MPQEVEDMNELDSQPCEGCSCQHAIANIRDNLGCSTEEAAQSYLNSL